MSKKMDGMVILTNLNILTYQRTQMRQIEGILKGEY